MKVLITIRVCALCLCCSLAIAQSREGGEPAISADNFVNSIGVNIHLQRTDTPYANYGVDRRSKEGAAMAIPLVRPLLPLA